MGRQYESSISEINRTSATTDTYVGFKIKNFGDARDVIRDTFGRYLKNNVLAWWDAKDNGLDCNVTADLQNIINDPNGGFETGNRRFYYCSAVGNLKPYNEAGRPSGGCFTMFTLG